MCETQIRGMMNKTPERRKKGEIMRLDKLVSMLGFTRSEAKKLISSGRVKIDDSILRDPGANVKDDASIEIGGEIYNVKKHIHVMIYKPSGVLTATEDHKGARTVADFLPEALLRRGIGPVGRLDKDVTGLVIMTTDGQLAHRLISPKWEVTKRYRATVEGKLDEKCVSAFQTGIQFKDFTSKPAGLEILSANENESVCLVYVTEGKFHQVKRMLQAVGHPVITLHREKIAMIELDENLSEGEWRELTDDEVKKLYILTEMNEK